MSSNRCRWQAQTLFEESVTFRRFVVSIIRTVQIRLRLRNITLAASSSGIPMQQKATGVWHAFLIPGMEARGWRSDSTVLLATGNRPGRVGRTETRRARMADEIPTFCIFGRKNGKKRQIN